MDHPLIIHGLFMGYQWIIHGLSMDYPWIINGLSMDNPWIIHGLSMDYPWIIHWSSIDIHWYPWKAKLAIFQVWDALPHPGIPNNQLACYIWWSESCTTRRGDGRKFHNLDQETKRFLFQGVSQGQTAAAANEDWMDIKAERERRAKEQETMRIELEHAFEQQEKAQRIIARAKLARNASDETRLAGVPNPSAPMSSIHPASLQKQNDSVLMTTTAPLCVRCDIPMMSSSSLVAALPCVFVFFPCVVFVFWPLGQQRTQPSNHIQKHLGIAVNI